MHMQKFELGPEHVLFEARVCGARDGALQNENPTV